MGTLLASELIAQASELAQDESNVTWSVAQALRWLNEAQRSVASVRPDSSISTASALLIVGTKQKISGRRIMGITRNMGSDGLTCGKAIRLVERGVKDDFNPDWHCDDPSLVVKEYIYDERLPQDYWVWPPVSPSADVYIEVLESVDPADVSSSADVITLNDIYAPSIIEWMAYRFFARDAEEIPELQRAALHFKNFFTLMGEKVSVDMAVSPKVRAQLE